MDGQGLGSKGNIVSEMSAVLILEKERFPKFWRSIYIYINGYLVF